MSKSIFKLAHNYNVLFHKFQSKWHNKFLHNNSSFNNTPLYDYFQ